MYEKTCPNWLTMLNLGQTKVMPSDFSTINRWERLQKSNLLQEIKGYIPVNVDLDSESFIREEIEMNSWTLPVNTTTITQFQRNHATVLVRLNQYVRN